MRQSFESYFSPFSFSSPISCWAMNASKFKRKIRSFLFKKLNRESKYSMHMAINRTSIIRIIQLSNLMQRNDFSVEAYEKFCIFIKLSSALPFLWHCCGTCVLRSPAWRHLGSGDRFAIPRSAAVEADQLSEFVPRHGVFSWRSVRPHLRRGVLRRHGAAMKRFLRPSRRWFLWILEKKFDRRKNYFLKMIIITNQ